MAFITIDIRCIAVITSRCYWTPWTLAYIHIFLNYLLLVPLIAIGIFFLQPAIGIVLGFIGTKMVFDFFGEQLETTLVHAIVNTFLYTLRFKLCFGFSISNTRWQCWSVAGYHIPTEASLAIVTTCLSGGVILSLRKASTEEKDK